MITGFDEFDSLTRFQLFFARQHFFQQCADNLFRLRALESVYWLTVLEQINRRDGAQAKLRSDHLLGVAVELGENKLTVVLGGKALQYRRQLQAVLAALRPKIEQDRRGHRLFKGLLQVRFVNVNNILCGHGVTLFCRFLVTWGLTRVLQLNPVKFCPLCGLARGV